MKHTVRIRVNERAHGTRSDNAKLKQRLRSRAQHLAGVPTLAATSDRISDGKPLVTDGPFAETREQLGG